MRFRVALTVAVLWAVRPVDFAAAQVREPPYFVSLRADTVNVRSGPSYDAPKIWIYRRKWMPMEILERFDVWRKVRDWEESTAWVHRSMLSARRTFIVTADRAELRTGPKAGARPVAILERGVIGDIKECPEDGDWCLLSYNGGEYRGWMERGRFWGAYPLEAIE